MDAVTSQKNNTCDVCRIGTTKLLQITLDRAIKICDNVDCTYVFEKSPEELMVQNIIADQRTLRKWSHLTLQGRRKKLRSSRTTSTASSSSGIVPNSVTTFESPITNTQGTPSYADSTASSTSELDQLLDDIISTSSTKNSICNEHVVSPTLDVSSVSAQLIPSQHDESLSLLDNISKDPAEWSFQIDLLNSKSLHNADSKNTESSPIASSLTKKSVMESYRGFESAELSESVSSLPCRNLYPTATECPANFEGHGNEKRSSGDPISVMSKESLGSPEKCPPESEHAHQTEPTASPELDLCSENQTKHNPPSNSNSCGLPNSDQSIEQESIKKSQKVEHCMEEVSSPQKELSSNIQFKEQTDHNNSSDSMPLLFEPDKQESENVEKLQELENKPEETNQVKNSTDARSLPQSSPVDEDSLLFALKSEISPIVNYSSPAATHDGITELSSSETITDQKGNKYAVLDISYEDIFKNFIEIQHINDTMMESCSSNVNKEEDGNEVHNALPQLINDVPKSSSPSTSDASLDSGFQELQTIVDRGTNQQSSEETASPRHHKGITENESPIESNNEPPDLASSTSSDPMSRIDDSSEANDCDVSSDDEADVEDQSEIPIINMDSDDELTVIGYERLEKPSPKRRSDMKTPQKEAGYEKKIKKRKICDNTADMERESAMSQDNNTYPAITKSSEPSVEKRKHKRKQSNNLGNESSPTKETPKQAEQCRAVDCNDNRICGTLPILESTRISKKEKGLVNSESFVQNDRSKSKAEKVSCIPIEHPSPIKLKTPKVSLKRLPETKIQSATKRRAVDFEAELDIQAPVEENSTSLQDAPPSPVLKVQSKRSNKRINKISKKARPPGKKSVKRPPESSADITIENEELDGSNNFNVMINGKLFTCEPVL